MTKYRLTYFNLRGRAEVIRFLFHMAGVQYEDVRIELAEWPNRKEEVNPLFGKLPLLSIDGVEYCQSHPIGRYLAEKFGFAGKTDLDKLRADMVVHCCEDFAPEMIKIHEAEADKKEEVRAKFHEGAFKTMLSNFEKILTQNNGGEGFFVGDSITWADLTFFSFLTGIEHHGGPEATRIFGTYPKLAALRARVAQVPKVAEWIAQRPDNPF